MRFLVWNIPFEIMGGRGSLGRGGGGQVMRKAAGHCEV